MRSTTALAASFALLLSAATAVDAQTPKSAEPLFRTAPPVVKTIVVEEEYGFAQRRYDPPVDVTPVDRSAAKDDTPEATTIAILSAMSRGDVAWFRSLWDPESARILAADDKKYGRDDTSWTAAWARTLRDRRIVLTNRIESGDYVLITYDLIPLQPNHKPEEVLHLETPLKLQNGRWLATQELSSDPVLLYWKTPDVRPRRVVRGPRS
jgi:hypothetical protein